VARKFVISELFEKIGLFELFMFFWCVAFGVAVEQLIMATAVSCWYFLSKHQTPRGKQIAAKYKDEDKAGLFIPYIFISINKADEKTEG